MPILSPLKINIVDNYLLPLYNPQWQEWKPDHPNNPHLHGKIGEHQLRTICTPHLNIESWSKRGHRRGHQIVQVGNIMYYFLDDNAHGESGEHVRRTICSQYGFRLLLYSPALPPLPLHRYNTSTASIRGQCTMCNGVFILIVNLHAIVTQ